jgi:hypothetical protein
MKSKAFPMIAAAAILLAANLAAQAATPLHGATQLMTPSTGVPMLAAVPAQVLQLHRSNVSEDTILKFIQNSPANYRLDASQIIYLKQQGVGDTVITALVNHQRAPVIVQPVAAYPPPYPYYYPYPGYPYYGWPYPPVAFRFGFGWRR